MTDFDGVMRALSEWRRRQILDALRDEERIDPFPDDERERTIQLHHVHLPLLEEHGLVAWNRETGSVRRGSEFDAVEPVLTALDERREGLPAGYLPEEWECVGKS
jgi:hypothetical protein